MKIMAVDLGDARTGLAVCDKTEFLASPVGVIHERSFAGALNKVAAAAREYEVGEVVVGHPLNMNGTEGPRAKKTRDFAAKLQLLLPDLPIRLWDERGTTLSATRILNETDVRGERRKAVVDEVAATVILESYLQFRKNTAAKHGD